MVGLTWSEGTCWIARLGGLGSEYDTRGPEGLRVSCVGGVFRLGTVARPAAKLRHHVPPVFVPNDMLLTLCLVGLAYLEPATALTLPAIPATSQTVADEDAGLELASLWSSGMVIPADRLVTLWGWGAPGERVTVEVSWTEISFGSTADSDGRFEVELQSPKPGGPHVLTVSQGEQRIELDDVLSGLVWIASGQSNMEWALYKAESGEEAVAAAEHPQLRLFQVPKRVSLDPEPKVDARWQACTPESAEEFSAVAYFFGLELRDAMDVPVGLVHTSWGGTPVESWMPSEDVAEHGGFTMQLLDQEAQREAPDASVPTAAELQAEWIAGLDAAEGDLLASYASAKLNDASWSTIEQPGQWEPAGIAFDGALWLRTSFELKADPAEGEWTLQLGPIDDQDRTFINGTEVGRNERPGVWNQPRSYTFESGVLQSGTNVLAVRALDTGGAGGMGGTAEDLVLVGPNGQRIELAGTWRYAESVSLSSLPAYPWEQPGVGYRDPCVLWNGMVAGLEGFGYEGALWYQGESNVSRPGQYATLFPAMIETWQRRLGSEGRAFPFYFVQIAPFAYGGDRGNAARLREAQAGALDLEHTGMAVTVDIGDPKDIHPTNKLTVGERLARLALARAYGLDVADSGPELIGSRIVGPEMFLYFDQVGGGLSTSDGLEVIGLEIAGGDREFHSAEAVVGRDLLVLRSSEVSDPVAARYCFDAASEGNLVGAGLLPMAPFRTDDWPMRTASELNEELTFEPLFDSSLPLGGFEVVNGLDSTWTLQDGVLKTDGHPISLLRSPERYRNFVVEVEYRHLNRGGNAGIFAWSDPMPATGVPFSRGVEVQVLDGIEGDWFTSDGDIFPIHGATMEPINGRGGMRAFPTQRRANPAPMWNHYRIECIEGGIKLWLNGVLVTQGSNAAPREGFLMFEAEGAPCEFRNARIAILPEGESELDDSLRAAALAPWRQLDGSEIRMQGNGDLRSLEQRTVGWQEQGRRLTAAPDATPLALGNQVRRAVQPEGGRANSNVVLGAGAAPSAPNFRALRFDYRRLAEPSEGGLPVDLYDIDGRPVWMPIAAEAERSVGSWNRLEIRAEAQEVEVWLNGELAFVAPANAALAFPELVARGAGLEIMSLFVMDS